jgi:hypothetical protein
MAASYDDLLVLVGVIAHNHISVVFLAESHHQVPISAHLQLHFSSISDLFGALSVP